MEIIKPEIEGLLILRPRIFTDARGYFFESYSKKCFDEAVDIRLNSFRTISQNQAMVLLGVFISNVLRSHRLNSLDV